MLFTKEQNDPNCVITQQIEMFTAGFQSPEIRLKESSEVDHEMSFTSHPST